MDDDRERAARRLDTALALADEGDHTAAAELLKEACALAPNWPEAHFALGEELEKAGEPIQAIMAYRHAIASDPEDRMGAQLRLVLLGAAEQPDRHPRAYVEALYDQEADRFEEKLRNRLTYQGPEAIAESLSALLKPGQKVARALDLGCGTGLAGAILRPLSDHITGLDLSARMLRNAEKTGYYDTLIQADILEDPWWDDVQEPGPGYDLITAADVMIYIGDLGPVLLKAVQALKPGGWFLFTLEDSTDEAVKLGEAHRFRHSRDAVRGWADAAGLIWVDARQIILRYEKQHPVESWVCVLQRPTRAMVE